MKDVLLSAIVISKNDEEKIKECLESLGFAGEIIVIDNGSSDKSFDIARKFTDKVYSLPKVGFSELRNEGLNKASGKWVLYVDTDERVTPGLRQELEKIIDNKDGMHYEAYAIPRKNIIFGKEMKHGGLYPDYVKRLYLKSSLKKWEGDLHEEPVYEGVMGHMSNPLIHLKHARMSEMIEKTNKWSEIEAKLLLDSGHPEMTWWRFPRIMLTEIWYRLIILKGFMDGIEGVIYSIYQMWSKFITYAKLWEMQRGESKE
jgi:glycosyltransferase involved in cell wall biosynthesis